MSVARVLVAASIATIGCWSPSPAFQGKSDAAWTSFEVTIGEPGDEVATLTMFELRASARGCTASQHCSDRSVYGRISGPRGSRNPDWRQPWDCEDAFARCKGDVIAIKPIGPAQYAIGCMHPITLDRCRALAGRLAVPSWP